MTQSQSRTRASRQAPQALAVLTGDLVKSSRLSEAALDAAMEALRVGAATLGEWRGEAPGQFSRFRGDGWQCVAPSPVLALRACLYLRACLRQLGREFETRISVGIGPGSLSSDAPERWNALAAASGAAFELSGRGLDDMNRARLLVIDWSEPPADATLIDAIFALSDEISRLWTPRQAQFLVETLSPGDTPQERLAERRGITQQTVAAHLRAGGEWALRTALTSVEGHP
jgi:hypothetical protein